MVNKVVVCVLRVKDVAFWCARADVGIFEVWFFRVRFYFTFVFVGRHLFRCGTDVAW